MTTSSRHKARPYNIRTRGNSDPQFLGVLEINTQTKQRSLVRGFPLDQYTNKTEILSSWVIPEINTQIKQRSSVRGLYPRSAHNNTAILSSWVIPEINI
ncbi:hypothetical protein AHAS_Ahas19G0183300 [Arachis hypogaea]